MDTTEDSEDGIQPLTPEQERLVLDHLEFAERGAKKYCRMWGRWYSFEEMKSAAYLGLMEAARRFDPARGVKFTSFSFYWINMRLLLVPMVAARQSGWAWNYSRKDRADGKKGMERVVRVESWPVNEDGEPMDVAAPATDDIDRREDADYLRILVLATVTKERDRQIMAMRFEGSTQEEAGAPFGLTRGRVQQIEVKIIALAQRRLRRTHPQLFVT